MSDSAPGSRPAYTWTSATVNSLGGPLLVCEADAFAHWGGAEHGPGGEPDPACDYGRALSAVDDEETGFIRFGDRGEHKGLLWDMEGEGTAEVALSADGFLLLRSWLPQGGTAAPRRRAAGASPAEETEVGDLELPGGRVVVAWAAAGSRENDIGSFADPGERAAALRALARLHPPVPLHLDHVLHVGALLSTEPGIYRVSSGWHEGTRGRSMPAEERHGPPRAAGDDDWSCLWVRFSRRGH
ncbi:MULTISPECIES: hypothetical protein [Streptomyces]|uniref:hypothetical protein n=1 Tax=Streptomyces TaxID=1883 RepID=UPI00025CBF61|nr:MULTISPECIES: hypothetical protein [Streptomyces]EIF94435.1 hypothetical protein [Streptomyces tsukubensis NRRL18488]